MLNIMRFIVAMTLASFAFTASATATGPGSDGWHEDLHHYLDNSHGELHELVGFLEGIGEDEAAEQLHEFGHELGEGGHSLAHNNHGSNGNKVPEPAMVGLLAMGLIGLVVARRRPKV